METTHTLEALTEALKSAGASLPEYHAEFVPQRFSRNRDEKHASLNWKIVLRSPRAVIETDYMQGIGLLPDYFKRIIEREAPMSAVYRATLERDMAENKGNYAFNNAKHWPKLTDILYSLVSDASGTDEPFEDWAPNLGYDPDSRKAEAVYNECRRIAAKLGRMFGPKGMEALQTFFQDY